MRNQLKIVFIQNQLGDLGGVSKFCQQLATGLRQRGYETAIYGVSHPRDDARIAYGDIPSGVFTTQLAPVRESFRGPFAEMRFKQARQRFRNAAYAGARQIFETFDENTIVVFTQIYAKEMTRDITDRAHRAASYRVICQYHSSFEAARDGRDLRRAQQTFIDADLFLLLTAEDAQKFQRRGFNNTGFVLNPAGGVSAEGAADLSQKRVISLGRYAPEKSLDHLIAAWAMLREEFPDWQLHLYGSGPLEEELAAEIEARGLQDVVMLRGATADPAAAYLSGSIHAQSSQHEGLPLTLIEASELGVPSIAYNCAAGVAATIKDGESGLLIERNDIAALADGLRRLMASQELRESFGAAARAHAQATFGLDVILDQWERIFADVRR